MRFDRVLDALLTFCWYALLLLAAGAMTATVIVQLIERLGLV